MKNEIKEITREINMRTYEMNDISCRINNMGVIAAYKASKEFKESMLKYFTEHKDEYCRLSKKFQEMVDQSPAGTFSDMELANAKALDQNIRVYEEMFNKLQKMFYPDPKAEKNIINDINKSNIEKGLAITGIVIGTGGIGVLHYFVFKAVREAIYGSMEQYTTLQNVASATVTHLSIMIGAAIIIGVPIMAIISYTANEYHNNLDRY